MADFVFNIAKGKVKYYAELPAAADALIAILEEMGLRYDRSEEYVDNLTSELASMNAAPPTVA